MTIEGTVVNGVIVLDSGAPLPEGTRVRIELAEEGDYFPPADAYDREKELEIQQEALGDVRAGRGMLAREFLKELATKHNLPLEAGE